MNDEHSNIICKGIIGVGANLLAVITSQQEHLEWMTRMASLMVGIAVGVLTLVSLIRNMRRKK